MNFPVITFCLQVKSKVAAKSGTASYQWEIMQNMGLADENIKAYVSSYITKITWISMYSPSISILQRNNKVFNLCITEY